MKAIAAICVVQKLTMNLHKRCPDECKTFCLSVKLMSVKPSVKPSAY